VGSRQYVLDGSRAALFDRVLETPEEARYFCSIVPEDLPVLFYADIDVKQPVAPATPFDRDAVLGTVLTTIEQCYRRAYGPDVRSLRKHLWVFEACTETKVSFHLHGSPSTPHVVWASREQLRAFITQQNVSHLVQQALSATQNVFDTSVYSKNSLFKLPLCSKPGGQAMALYQWGSGLRPSDREQLDAGMITLPVVTAAWHWLALLEVRKVSSAPAVAGCSGTTTHRGTIAAHQPDDGLIDMVSKLLTPTAGAAAMIDPSEWRRYNNPTRVQGVYVRQTAKCPFVGRCHRSNRLCFRVTLVDAGAKDGRRVQLAISCFGCPGRYHRVNLTKPAAKTLYVLLEGATDAGEQQASAGATACSGSVDAGAAPDDVSQTNPSVNDITVVHPSEPAPVLSFVLSLLSPYVKHQAQVAAEWLYDQHSRQLTGSFVAGTAVCPRHGDAADGHEMHFTTVLDTEQGPTMVLSCGASACGYRHRLSLSYHQYHLMHTIISAPRLTPWEEEGGRWLMTDINNEHDRDVAASAGHQWSYEYDDRYVLPFPTDVEAFNERHAAVFGNHRYVLLKAAMGSGKTAAVKHHLAKLLEQCPQLRVLFVVPRISLAENLAVNLNYTSQPLEFRNYRTSSDKELLTANRLIICVDSIWKLNKRDGRHDAQRWDVVVIDEVETVLAQFGSDTMHGKGRVWGSLNWACKTATHQVIAMDADAGPRAIQWLRRFEVPDEPIHAVRNICPVDSNAYRIVDSYENWLLLLMQRIKVGDNIVVPMNGKQVAEQLKEYLERKLPFLKGQVILYTSDTDAPVKRQASDCNNIWVHYRVVIYSPTIGPGVDFNPPAGAHFHKMFAYAGNTSNTVRDMSQMMGRVRHLMHKQAFIHFAVSGFDQPLETDVGKLRDQLYLRYRNSRQLPDEHFFMDSSLDDNGDPLVGDDDYCQLYLANQQEQNWSKRCFPTLMIRSLTAKGVDVDYVTLSDPTAEQAVAHELWKLKQEMWRGGVAKAVGAKHDSIVERSLSQLRVRRGEALTDDLLKLSLDRMQTLLGLHQYSTVKEGDGGSTPAHPLLKHAIRLYKDHLDAVQLFDACLQPMQWLQSAGGCTPVNDQLPDTLHQLDTAICEKAMCLKVLLYVMGLIVDADVLGAGVDGWCVLSRQKITTESIKTRLLVQSHQELLERYKLQTAKHWDSHWETASVGSLMRVLRRMLAKFSIELETEPGRSNKHGKTWSLDHGHALSLLELLYARHHASQVMYRGPLPTTEAEHELSSPHNVLMRLLQLHRASFQWTPLTGIATPEALSGCRPLWDPDALKSPEERQLKKQRSMLLQKKRKLGSEEDKGE
jgi:hypothetical protein